MQVSMPMQWWLKDDARNETIGQNQNQCQPVLTGE